MPAKRWLHQYEDPPRRVDAFKAGIVSLNRWYVATRFPRLNSKGALFAERRCLNSLKTSGPRSKQCVPGMSTDPQEVSNPLNSEYCSTSSAVSHRDCSRSIIMFVSRTAKSSHIVGLASVVRLCRDSKPWEYQTLFQICCFSRRSPTMTRNP